MDAIIKHILSKEAIELGAYLFSLVTVFFLGVAICYMIMRAERRLQRWRHDCTCKAYPEEARAVEGPPVDPNAPTKYYPLDRRHLWAFPDTMLDLRPLLKLAVPPEAVPPEAHPAKRRSWLGRIFAWTRQP